MNIQQYILFQRHFCWFFLLQFNSERVQFPLLPLFSLISAFQFNIQFISSQKNFTKSGNEEMLEGGGRPLHAYIHRCIKSQKNCRLREIKGRKRRKRKSRRRTTKPRNCFFILFFPLNFPSFIPSILPQFSLKASLSLLQFYSKSPVNR